MQLSQAVIRELIELFERSELVTLHIKTDEAEVMLSSEVTPVGASAAPEPRSAAPVAVAVPASAPGSATAPEPAAPVPAATTAAPAAPTPEHDALVTVTAPALGVFYHAPRPDQPPYVKVGSHVAPDTTVGLIEAMKVYTAVAAGVSGTVREIVTANNEFVEFGQALIRIELDADEGAGR